MIDLHTHILPGVDDGVHRQQEDGARQRVHAEDEGDRVADLRRVVGTQAPAAPGRRH